MAFENLFHEAEAAVPVLLAVHGVPGLSIAVVDGDRVIWLRAFGVTEIGKSKKVTVDTLFSMQSISKPCVAVGFLGTMDAVLDERLGVVALTNSVSHPNVQLSLSRRLLSDLVDITRSGQTDCPPPADPLYCEYIGLYEAPYNGGISRKAVSLRCGQLYLESERLARYSERLFFTDDGESVEFGREQAAIANVRYDGAAPGPQPERLNPPGQLLE